MDFESISLAARTHCHGRYGRGEAKIALGLSLVWVCFPLRPPQLARWLLPAEWARFVALAIARRWYRCSGKRGGDASAVRRRPRAHACNASRPAQVRVGRKITILNEFRTL